MVTGEGEVAGIPTERAVMKKFCFDTRCALMKAEEVTSSPLVIVDGDATLGEAINMMTENNIRRLLATEDGEILEIDSFSTDPGERSFRHGNELDVHPSLKEQEKNE